MIHATLVLLGMLAGHYCADRLLQPGFLSARKRDPDPVIRWQTLGLHGAAHGFFVAIVTGSAVLAVAEWIAHAAIDRGKGRGWYGLIPDQALHVLCKLVWLAILERHLWL